MKRSRQPKIHHSVLIVIILLAISVTGVFADSSKEAHLIIVGPGDPLYTYWGHIGIAIGNSDTGKNQFYDFGNFSFYSESFYRDFAMGRMLYLGLETPTDWFVSYSLEEDRDLYAYPLDLGNEELEILEQRLKWWMEPENREYLYEYYHSNCSTIIRDVLDEATGGALDEASGNRTDRSFRYYTRTGAAPSITAELLLHFLLGPSEDYSITEWEQMFLPQSVADQAMNLEYRSLDGETRTLASEPLVLKKSSRSQVPDEYRNLWIYLLITGILCAGLWTASGILSEQNLWSRITAGVLRILITLLVGIPGLLLGFMMLFTDHISTYGNLNIGPAIPTVILGLIPIIGLMKKGGEKRRKHELRLAWLWTVNLGGLALVMILRATGISIQDAFAFWAFFTPLLLLASRPGLWLREKLIRTAG